VGGAVLELCEARRRDGDSNPGSTTIARRRGRRDVSAIVEAEEGGVDAPVGARPARRCGARAHDAVEARSRAASACSRFDQVREQELQRDEIKTKGRVWAWGERRGSRLRGSGVTVRAA